MRGLFITFEGGEGTGKSTQIRLLDQRLRAAGLTVRTVREPGDTAVGEAVRRLLLDGSGAGMDPLAELLLFEASRAQLMREVICPSLERDEIVLCDRFTDSTMAYQGWGRGIAEEVIGRLNEIATGGRVPDRTLVLDIALDQGMARATQGGADRIEAEDADFHRRVREGFLAIARLEPSRVRVVDAAGTIEQVAERTAAALGDMPVIASALDGHQ